MSIYDEIFTQLIPTVDFDKITLSGGRGSSPLKVKINFDLREGVEDDMISSWFASSFEETPDSSPFEQYLKVRIVQCTNPDLCEVLSGRADQKLFSEKGESMKKAFEQTSRRDVNLKSKIPVDRSTVTREKGMQEYRITQPDGTEIIEIPIEETFVVQPSDLLGIEHLSYFVWVTLDLPQLANDFGVSEKFFKKSSPPSTVASEYVIENYNVITSTNVHVLPSGDPWSGPIHYHDPKINPAPSDPTFKGYMTGRSHTSSSQKLNTMKVANSKIRDFRFVDRVDERYRSVTQARIGAGLVEGEAKVGETIDENVIAESVITHTKLLGKEVTPDKKSSVFTNMVLTTDEAHNGNGLFAIDFVAFLKKNSAYPYLWDISKETTLKLLSMSQIGRLAIYRQQVDPNSRGNNRLGTPHLPMLKGDDYKINLLGSTSQHKGKNLCKTIDTSRIYLTETKVDLYGMKASDTDGIRWFSFTDYGLINQRNGTYQYSVLLKCLDPTTLLLNRNISRLRTARRSLQKYLSDALGYTKTQVNFDIYLDKFIPEFIKRYYEPNRRNRWLRPIKDYLKTLKEVSNVLEAPAYAGSSYNLESVLPAVLSSYVDPVKGSPEGIQRTLNMIDQLLVELESKSGGLSSGSRIKNKKAQFSKQRMTGKAHRRILEEKYTFGQELTLDGNRGKGYDYLTNQTLDFVSDNIKGKGLRILTSRYYKKRCEIETRRFFKVADSAINYEEVLRKAVPDLSLSRGKSEDTLTESKFSYLTPSFVFRSWGQAAGGMGGATGAPSTPAHPAQVGGTTQGADAAVAGQQFGNQGISGMSGVTQGAYQVESWQDAVPQFTQQQIENATTNTTTSIAPSEQEPTSVEEVHSDVIAAQQNPDFSLFPISVKGYEGEHRGTKQSAQEQNTKKKYMDILASQGTMVVSARREFFTANADMNNRAHPYTFYEQDSSPSDENLNIPTGPDYEVIDFVTDAGVKENFLPYRLMQPVIPKFLLNINPTPVLSTLASSNVGLKMGTPYSPLAYRSFHVSNFQLLNFNDTKTPNILDGINPSHKSDILKKLPNQLKALVLAGRGSTIRNPFESEGPDEKPWMFDPVNMPKIWQLFGNITRIEYLSSFDAPQLQVQSSAGLVKVEGSRPLMKSPQWKVLTKAVVDRLENGNKKMALLCKVSRYVNKALGIGYSSKLDLPIVDQYFLMVIDPFVEQGPDLGRLDAVDQDGNLSDEFDPTVDPNPWDRTTGQSNDSSGTDSETIEMYFKDAGMKNIYALQSPDADADTTEDGTPETITVKVFEGEVILSNCNSGGSS